MTAHLETVGAVGVVSSAVLDRITELLIGVSAMVGLIAVVFWWLAVLYGVLLLLHKSINWLIKWLWPAK